MNDELEKKRGMIERQLEDITEQYGNMQKSAFKYELAKRLNSKVKDKLIRAEEAIQAIDLAGEDENKKGEGLKLAESVVKDVGEYIDLIKSFIEGMDIEIEEKIGNIKNEVDKEINKKYKNKDEWVNILHFSDLHFGSYYYNLDSAIQEHENFNIVIKDQLFNFFINNNIKIDIVALTGDISYRNNEKGYEDFKIWLKELCGKNVLNLNLKKNVIMCPGNHDSGYDNRKKYGLVSKEEASKNAELKNADDELIIDKLPERQKQFERFNNMCSSLEIKKLENFEKQLGAYSVPYVIGKRVINGINFVVLNTAWNSFPETTNAGEDNGSCYGNLFLGRQLLNVLFSKLNKDIPTVMLFHHPFSWLHETEVRIYKSGQPLTAFHLVKEYSDIILNGHIHGKIDLPDLLGNKTLVFNGGTLYLSAEDMYQFEIISINKTNHYCTQRIVRYNRQKSNVGWEEVNDNYLYQFHYGDARDTRELITKICLGEITDNEAYELAKNMGKQSSFAKVYQKSRYYRIYDKIKKSVEKYSTQIAPEYETIKQRRFNK